MPPDSAVSVSGADIEQHALRVGRPTSGRRPDDFWFIALNSGAYGWSPVPSKTIQDAPTHQLSAESRIRLGLGRSFWSYSTFSDENSHEPLLNKGCDKKL